MSSTADVVMALATIVPQLGEVKEMYKNHLTTRKRKNKALHEKYRKKLSPWVRAPGRSPGRRDVLVFRKRRGKRKFKKARRSKRKSRR